MSRHSRYREKKRRQERYQRVSYDHQYCPLWFGEIVIRVDKELLRENSEFYNSMCNFHGTDSFTRDLFVHPNNSPFTKHCFAIALSCLGTREKFETRLDRFNIRELFHVAVYLQSDPLLYHVLFDLVRPENCVLFAMMAFDTLTDSHFVTRAVIHYIMGLITKTYNQTLEMLRTKTRYLLTALVQDTAYAGKPFLDMNKRPVTCLMCRGDIYDMNIKTRNRLSPMICCGMFFHMKCILKFFNQEKQRCPSCGMIFKNGILTPTGNKDAHWQVHHLNTYGMHPLPYRVRHDIIWTRVTAQQG